MPINDEKAVLYSQNTEQEDVNQTEEKAETRGVKTEQNDDKLMDENTLAPNRSIPGENLTESPEFISNDPILAEVDESVEDVLLMDEMVLPEMAPTTMVIADMESEIEGAELFIIEPIGDNLELLDDLFVTF